MGGPSESFLQRLKSVRLRALGDRVRVSTPCDPITETFQSHNRGQADSKYEEGVRRFHDRVKAERLLTMTNNDELWTADVQNDPEEYFDICYVFNSHPVDFGPREESATPTGGSMNEGSSLLLHGASSDDAPRAERTKLFEELDRSHISKADMRYYISQACCYRDLDGMERDAQADSETSYFSSFSMTVHHQADAQRDLFSDPRVAGLFKAVPKWLRSRSRGELRTDIELTQALHGTRRASSVGGEAPTGHAQSQRPLSPPLALLPGVDGSPGRFTSAGASSLPAFYGLSESLNMLDDVDDNFEMPMLDFLFVMREVFTSALRKCGADLSEFVSDDETKLFVKARLREQAARQVANHIEYICQCDTSATTYEFLKRDPTFQAPFLPYDRSAEDPVNGFYAAKQGRQVWRRYDGLSRCLREGVPRLGSHAEDSGEDHSEEDMPGMTDPPGASLFRDVDRLRLLSYLTSFHFNLDVMSSPYKLGGGTPLRDPEGESVERHGSPTSKCLEKRDLPAVILAEFPMHKRHRLLHLGKIWANFRYAYTTEQPLDLIRDYFGEQVSFYFLWTGFLTDALRRPALIGSVVFAMQMLIARQGRYEAWSVQFATAAFAVYMSIWASRLAVKWHNIERFWRLRWGMESERLSTKIERPSFCFDYFVVDPLNPRRLSKYYNATKTKLRSAASAFATFISLLIIIMCVVGIYSLKYLFQFLPEDWQWIRKYESTIISTTQASQIVIFDYLWCAAVRWLTNFENHRYVRDYSKSFVGKMFLFRFMNNFYALLYIAFARNYVEPCAPAAEGGCMNYFQLQLFILYVLFLFFNVVELGLPFTSFLFNEAKMQIKESGGHDFVELQFCLPPYESSSLVEDYMEIVIQYCAVVFFSVALPIVPLFSYCQNLMEIRVDAYKLINVQRRVFPHVAPEGLATYNDIINLIGIVTPPVNVALCIFLVPFGSHSLSLGRKLLAFLMAEHFLLLLKMYTQFNSADADSRVDALREGMRLIAHEIVWGNANRLYYGAPGGLRPPLANARRVATPAVTSV